MHSLRLGRHFEKRRISRMQQGQALQLMLTFPPGPRLSGRSIAPIPGRAGGWGWVSGRPPDCDGNTTRASPVCDRHRPHPTAAQRSRPGSSCPSHGRDTAGEGLSFLDLFPSGTQAEPRLWLMLGDRFNQAAHSRAESCRL